MIDACRHKLEARLDMPPITPDCAQPGESQLARMTLQCGTEEARLGDMFAISHCATKDKLVIRDSNDKMDYLGAA